ncbi:hypothetical protein GGF37_003289 [Kickxella alabastrina]|nr:hypothetical protein GGF37_003289 [Kickxella alabastrina]
MNGATDIPTSVRVFNNPIILEGIVKYLELKDLEQLSRTSRHAWRHVIPKMWVEPALNTIPGFRSFSTVVGNPLAITIGKYLTYGDIVRTIDLSMLGGRWEKVGSLQMVPIFKHCPNMRKLNMNLCQHIYNEAFVKLFKDNPNLCSSLNFLDISETMLTDESLEQIIHMTPNLTTLVINETSASHRTMGAIAHTLGDLEWLEIDCCHDIRAEELIDVGKSCTKLSHLIATGDMIDRDDDAVELIDRINEHGEWEDDGFGDDNGYSEYDDDNGYDDYDDFHGHGNDLGHEGYDSDGEPDYAYWANAINGQSGMFH